VILCRLADVADPGARGFTLEGPAGRHEVFVVRQGSRLYAYENSCPHIGTPLDFLPDQFLTRDRTQLLCGTHGARFEIATGLCVAGPCKGRSLRPVAVRVADGDVVIDHAAG
jgi:nitrite reductase/ring-hydroxylating ferredoxin subunit